MFLTLIHFEIQLIWIAFKSGAYLFHKFLILFWKSEVSGPPLFWLYVAPGPGGSLEAQLRNINSQIPSRRSLFVNDTKSLHKSQEKFTFFHSFSFTHFSDFFRIQNWDFNCSQLRAKRLSLRNRGNKLRKRLRDLRLIISKFTQSTQQINQQKNFCKLSNRLFLVFDHFLSCCCLCFKIKIWQTEFAFSS